MESIQNMNARSGLTRIGTWDHYFAKYLISFFAATAIMLFGQVTIAFANEQLPTATKLLRPLPARDAGIGEPWTTGTVASLFTNYTTQREPRFQTEARILYDDKNVYVRFACTQPQRSVVQSENYNDLAAETVDYVEVDIEPGADGARYYRFDATPNGLRRQQSSETVNYNSKWDAFGVVRDAEYDVVLVIPLNAMRGAGGSQQTWRVNLVRHVAQDADTYTWAYNPAMQDPHSDSKFWRLIGGWSIEPSAARQGAADVFVLTSDGRDRRRFTSLTGQRQVEGSRLTGVDLRLPLSRSVALVATLNPDFSNIERDQTRITPQEFPQRFRESRPFFAEGINFVSPLFFYGIAPTDIRPFYTPSIGIIDRGEKVEGTVGPHQFGILETKGLNFDDVAFGYQYAKPDQSLLLSFQDSEVHQAGLTDSTHGLAVTAQNPRSGVFGSVQFIQDRGTLVKCTSCANASVAFVGIHTASVNGGIGYEAIGPSFAPIAGYTANNDIHGPYANFGYGFPNALKLKEINVFVGGDRLVDGDGNVGQNDSYFNLSITTKKLVNFNFSDNTSSLLTYAQAYPSYQGRAAFAFNQRSVSLTIGSGKSANAFASIAWGPYATYCGKATFCSRNISGYEATYVQQPALSLSYPLGRAYLARFDYQGSVEHALYRHGADSQWLRRLTLSRNIGDRGSVNVQYRLISGNGGNSIPGNNLSISYGQRLNNLNQVYLQFGSPASTRTLDRVIVKYIFHIGQGPGT